MSDTLPTQPNQGNPKRICLVDFSSIHRIMWHSSEGDEISKARSKTLAAVVGYAAGYDAVGICVDRPPYKRKEIDPKYKEHREKTSAAILDQARDITEQLDADGYHILGADGYEADDIIATVTKWAEGHEYATTIYSADKDLMQLVSEYTVTISTMTRQKYDWNTVKEKFGVTPDLVADWLALVGDKSDGVPGVPGVGPKKAAEWLNGFGGLDGILADIDKLPERFRKIVADNREQLGTSRRLVTLMVDAPINPEVIMTEKERKPEPMPEPEVETIDEPKPETAMVRVEPLEGQSWERSLEPIDTTGAWKLADVLYRSRMFGDFPNREAILSVILTGRSMGLDSVASLRNFHVIKGEVSPSAQVLIGLVKRRKECRYFRLVSSDDKQATWETHREDESEPTRMDFRIEEATARGYLSKKDPNPWKTMAKTMLRWRAGVELARAVYPDITSGLYSIEEMEDM